MRNSLILLFCAVFIVGCSVASKPTQIVFPPTQADWSRTMEANKLHKDELEFLSVETCAAPCFLEITPGVTSESEARVIISNSKILSNCTEIRAAGNGISGIRCDGIGFLFREKAVLAISVTPRNTTAEDIIQKYGIPDKVNVILSPLPDSPIRSSVVFLYNQLRLQINFVEIDGPEYLIAPNTLVLRITFNDVNEQELVNGSGDGISTGVWKGYGVYEFK
ncbi:MAG: hypothetical protein HFACDABA_02468 [Anaerolineales bacterium]|nr:hypothetical protein [Anaerolineales bacterium]